MSHLDPCFKSCLLVPQEFFCPPIWISVEHSKAFPLLLSWFKVAFSSECRYLVPQTNTEGEKKSLWQAREKKKKTSVSLQALSQLLVSWGKTSLPYEYKETKGDSGGLSHRMTHSFSQQPKALRQVPNQVRISSGESVPLLQMEFETTPNLGQQWAAFHSWLRTWGSALLYSVSPGLV